MDEQNAAAMRQQQLTDLRLSISADLHQLRANLHDLRQIGAPETANLIRHLETFIKTDSYEEAIEEVKKLGPTKRVSEVSVYPLSLEKKQRRHHSYSSH